MTNRRLDDPADPGDVTPGDPPDERSARRAELLAENARLEVKARAHLEAARQILDRLMSRAA